MNNKVRYILYGVGLIIIFVLAWYFSTITTCIIISAVLATMGHPLVRCLNSLRIGKFHLTKTVSALITLVVIWTLFLGFFWLIIPLLISKFQYLSSIDVQSFLKALDEPVVWITTRIYGEPRSLFDASFITLMSEKITSLFKMSKVAEMVGSLAGMVGSFLVALFSVTFITFFFLKEEGSLRKGLLLLVPSGYEERVDKSFVRITKLLSRYFVGIVLEIIIVMTLDALGLFIVGLSFSDSVVIGLVCGLFNVIPYLGPWIGAGIGTIIGIAVNINNDFMTVLLPLVLLMIVVFVVVQLIDNILLQPFIYSNSVKAHPLEIFLVIMAAGSVFGVLGMILAIPTYTIIRIFAAEFMSNMKIVRKITENMDD